MDKQKLIDKIGSLDKLYGEKYYVALDDVLDLVKQLDEPETGHADEAPRYVKNILVRLRELPLHDCEVWLKAIMGEFEQEFNHAKWLEGYEQGKLGGEWIGNQLKDADKIRQELNKPVVPQFVAEWYEENKDDFETSLFQCVYEVFTKRNDNELTKIENWVIDENTKPFQTLVNMHQFGYKVEKKKRYLVKVKGICGNHETLNREKHSNKWLFSDREENSLYGTHHTRKELEDAGFGEVFNSPLFEVVEVE